MSANRQRPFVGFFTTRTWNTVRRARNQVLYVVPPFVVAYSLMEWAIERYVFSFSFLAAVFWSRLGWMGGWRMEWVRGVRDGMD